MEQSRARFTNFSDLPTALRMFVLSREFSSVDGRLQEQFHLTDQQTEHLGDVTMDAIFNQLALSQALQSLKQTLVPSPIAETAWPVFVTEFIKFEIWPLRELFGNELTQMMSEQQLISAGWPEFRVILKPLTYSGVASEVASRVGFALLGPMRERLRELILSKLKGVRIEAQVREVLVRQSAFGGLGLDAATADKTLDAINTLISSAQIMSEDEYANWLAEDTRKKLSDTKTAPSSEGEDDAEIEAIKARLPSAPQISASMLEQVVAQLITTLSYSAPDDYLAKRLQYVISSRLRNVRSALELNQLLQRDVKVGGLGLPNETAELLTTQIEAGYTQFHTPIMEDEKHKLSVQLQAQQVKIEERRQHEAEEHARWYREKIETRKRVEQTQSAATKKFKQAFTHPLDEQERAIEVQRFGEMVPVTSPPTTPEIKISKATLELSSAALTSRKPRVDEVKYSGPKLVGPLQELQAMTWGEFRRLAKDPEVAAQKIMQKIDTLGQESFERRLEGVKALQRSPLQEIYMRLISASLRAAQPVIQLAEAQRVAGQDVPSATEISAIISLNSKLHL